MLGTEEEGPRRGHSGMMSEIKELGNERKDPGGLSQPEEKC